MSGKQVTCGCCGNNFPATGPLAHREERCRELCADVLEHAQRAMEDAFAAEGLRDAADGEPVSVFPSPDTTGCTCRKAWKDHGGALERIIAKANPRCPTHGSPCDMCETAPGLCPRHDQAPVVAGRRVEQG